MDRLDQGLDLYHDLVDEYRTDAVLSIVQALGRERAALVINAALNGEVSINELRQFILERRYKQEVRRNG